MKIHGITKDSIEKLYDNKYYSKIAAIMHSCGYDDIVINTIISNSINASDPDDAKKNKDYLVNSVLVAIRAHNIDDDFEKFEPYDVKKNLKKEKLSGVITEEEKDYLERFKKKNTRSIKHINNKISQNAYRDLLDLYENEKENYYIGIHRTSSEMDPIFEEGILFGGTADFSNHIQKMHNYIEMLTAISDCEYYKNSYGAFVVKIPKKALDEGNYPIYYNKDNKIYLNPKYIACFVPVKNKKVLTPILNDHNTDIISDVCENDYIEGYNGNTWAIRT